MQQTSLLAALRSRDGRSLARALAVLVLFGFVAAGFHAGATAAADPLSVFCGTGDSGDERLPSDHLRDGCLAGCAAPMTAVADRGPILVLPATGAAGPALAASGVLPGGGAALPRARAPPFLA